MRTARRYQIISRGGDDSSNGNSQMNSNSDPGCNSNASSSNNNISTDNNGSSMNGKLSSRLSNSRVKNSNKNSSTRHDNSDQNEELLEFMTKIGAEHTSKAFKTFNQMRNHEELCDVEFIVDGQHVKAHKLLLASFSSYFHAMFTSPMVESNSNSVTLHGVDYQALKALIDYAYTSVIDINQDNVQVLLSTSSMLQMNCVRDACCRFLTTQLHPSNCLGISSFADTHSCHELHQLSYEYALMHFKEVIESEEFVTLPVDQIERLISSDVLNIDSEVCVFEAVNTWIKHAVDRQQYTAKLMEHVRLPLISREFLLNNVECNELIRNCNKCKDLLIDAMKYHLWPEKRSELHSIRSQYRKRCGASKVAIGVGGGSLFSIHSECEGLDIAGGCWIPIPSLLSRRARHSVAVINNIIYAVGGYDGNNVINTVEAYLPNNNKWKNVLSLGTKRSGLGTAVLSNLLYAIGGYDGTSPLCSAERYDPLTNQWTCIAVMNTKRRYVRAVALNNFIYAIGGYDGSTYLANVECYDPSLNQWKTVTSMLTRRSSPAVIVVDNMLYVCGGTDGTNCLQTMERYNPKANRWISLAPMNCKRNSHDLIAIDGWIYAIGGHDGNTSLNSVERYSIETNKWFMMSSMSTRRSSLGVGLCEIVLQN